MDLIKTARRSLIKVSTSLANSSNIKKNPPKLFNYSFQGKPSQVYMALINSSKIQYDHYQYQTMQKIDKFEKELNDHLHKIQISEESDPPQGLYIHGKPGTGKTFLMDLLNKSLKFSQKKRIHFNEFMLSIHKNLHDLKKVNKVSSNSLIKTIANEIRRDFKIVFLDEFQVTDIADAVLLKELFSTLFDNGVILIATSNRAPDDLYKNGLQKEYIFDPFLKILKSRCKTITLHSPTDYRTRGTRIKNNYFTPNLPENKEKFNKALQKVTGGQSPQKTLLNVFGRELEIKESYDKACRFDFQVLCGEARSAADYQAIARKYRAVFVEDVREINPDESELLRRFILLVDELYDAKVLLAMLSEVSVEKLLKGEEESEKVTGREDLFAWKRCKSRLIEMHSKEYLDENDRVSRGLRNKLSLF